MSTLQLPIIDLASSDRFSTSLSIRQACMEHGFFYLINHGVEGDLLHQVFEEHKKFIALPLEEKNKLAFKGKRGYTPLYAEKLDPLSTSKGDSKETFYIGPLEDTRSRYNLNQWPPQEILPRWRSTMEDYHTRVLDAGKRLISLLALALKLDENFFYETGALNQPDAFLGLLHYPGDLGVGDEEIYGASAHSDYGMITLLATDGVPGLQIRMDKTQEPQVWEDVHHVPGAFIVNIGDMMERWTNCLFRSTLHRVISTGQPRYSIAFFLGPSPDCVVECLKTCCSESHPPKYAPIRSGDYLEERIKLQLSQQKI